MLASDEFAITCIDPAFPVMANLPRAGHVARTESLPPETDLTADFVGFTLNLRRR
jgi:hypothetical protein